jgi:hypothetical protein
MNIICLCEQNNPKKLAVYSLKIQFSTSKVHFSPQYPRFSILYNKSQCITL